MRKTIANSSIWLMNPKHTSAVALVLTLYLGFGLRVFHLGEQSFWWDEVETTVSTQFSFLGLIQYLFKIRSHLPLYYIAMQFWGWISTNEFTYRYFSLLFGVLTIALIARAGRGIEGLRTSILAAFILAISPFNIWFSQEARMYTLLAFAVLAANWFLFRVLHEDNRRDWIGYTVSLIIATYCHYMAVLVVVAHYAFFSLHYRQIKPLFRKWLIYAGFAGMIFGLWIIAIMATGGFANASIDWIKPVRWFDPFLTILALSIGPSIDSTNMWPYLALFVYVVAIGIGFATYFLRQKESEQKGKVWLNTLTFRLLLLWLLVPIFLVFLISIELPIPRKRSIYMDRYLIVALPALILLGAWGLAIAYQEIKWRWFFPIGVILISTTSFFSLQNLYFNLQYARVDWRGAIENITNNWQEDDIYLMNLSQPIMAKYYGTEQLTTAEIPFSAYSDNALLAETELAHLITEIKNNHDRAWILTERPNINPHGFPQDRNNGLYSDDASKFAEDWLNRNCPRVDQWQYPGITLSLFEVKGCRFTMISNESKLISNQ